MIDVRTLRTVLAAAALAVVALAAHAQPAKTEGEVRKVDKDSGKVTIKHGPIANLDMPSMTMVFRVADPAMLERLKSGDKIVFGVEKIGGAYTVVSVDPAP